MDFINEFGLVAVTLESCNGKLKLNFVASEIGAGEEQCGFAPDCLEKEAIALTAIDLARFCAHVLALSHVLSAI
jgi:hypothetical protein